MVPRSRLVVVALTLALTSGGLVLAAPSATAESGLTPVVDITPVTPAAYDPDVTVGVDGTAYAVWVQVATGTVDFAQRLPGAAWSSPVSISERPSVGSPTLPQVVVDGRGGVTVAWTQSVGSSAQDSYPATFVASRAPGSDSFAAPVQLSPEGVFAPSFPQVALSPAGEVDVAFSVGNGSQTIYLATRAAGSGTWEPAVPVSDPAVDASDPHMGVDPVDGTVVVAWTQQFAQLRRVVAATRSLGDSFGQPVVLSGDGVFTAFPALAVGPDGRTVVTWSADLSPGYQVQLASRPSGGTFGAVVPVAEIPSLGAQADLVVAGGGVVTLVWNQFGSEPGVRTTTGTVADGFPVPDRLSDDVGVRDAVVSRGSNGDVVLAWDTDEGGEEGTIQMARLGPDRRPGPTVDVTALETGVVDYDPAVAVDAGGDATVVWTRYTEAPGTGDEQGQVRSRVLDGVAPVLGGVAVPATAVAQNAVPMSATATDRGPVKIAWAFGDGTSATGASTSHAYGAPGRYVVTVTASDDAGNVASATRSIEVTPVPVPPDRTPPALTGLRLSPTRLPTGVGAWLRVRSSEAATLVGTVQRKRGSGSWRSVGHRSWKLTAGANKKKLYGSVSQRRLSTGKYRVVLVATDLAGNPSTPHRLRFRVDRSGPPVPDPKPRGPVFTTNPRR